MTLDYQALPGELARAWRRGAPDAYGMAPERGHVSDGVGVPCRHCLHDVPAGRGYLVLAHRPFPELQPYAETGPIFLCEDDCARWPGQAPPPILSTSPDYLLKGYGADFRIVYGTGRVVPASEVPGHAAALLADQAIAFVDVRSARNNCWQLRICRSSRAVPLDADQVS